MSGFIELTNFDGSKISFKVDAITCVRETANSKRENFTSVHVSDFSLLVKEDYKKVLSLISIATKG